MSRRRRPAGPVPLPELVLTIPLFLLTGLVLPGSLLLLAARVLRAGPVLPRSLLLLAAPVLEAPLVLFTRLVLPAGLALTAWRARLGRGLDRGNGRTALAGGAIGMR